MSAPGILESLCPTYDARERHEVIVRAPAAQAYDALDETDFSRSLLVRLLLSLRSLPFVFRSRAARPAPLTFDRGIRSIEAAGFGIVAEDIGGEIVLGLQGDFWNPCPDVRPLQRTDLESRPAAGFARALWNFRVVPLDAGRSRLSTETRVVTGDDSSRRRFRAYWLLVAPFSGAIRRSMLRAVKRTAEQRARRPINSSG